MINQTRVSKLFLGVKYNYCAASAVAELPRRCSKTEGINSYRVPIYYTHTDKILCLMAHAPDAGFEPTTPCL